MSTLAINQRIIFSETTNRNTLIFVFFLSGFAGLIYESIWTQYLKLFLGHAAYAQTLVLIIFMGGMALGAWLTSKYLHKFKNLFLAYAIIEAIVGIFALVFHNIYVASTDFAYNTVMPFLGSSGPIEAFKWSLATLLILPQTILLGSTFPLMSAGFIHYFPEKKGHSLSILYFSNSFGAAIGVLVAGFYLVRTVGLPGTLLTAGLINFAVALVSWITSKQFADENIQLTHLAKQEIVTHKTLKILLIVAAVTGAASFMYEVAWIRMLSMVLGSSVHSFELMLSAFILGLAIGGFWIRNKISKIANPIQWLGYIQIIMGILAALTITFYNYTFDFMAFTMQALQRTEPGYIYFNLISHFICLVMMLPATICAGMTLPLITYILLDKGYNERAIGWVYATNTVGSIVGVTLAVQLIMPLLGLKNLIISGSILDIFIGLVLLSLLTKTAIYKKALIIILPLSLSALNFDQLKMASGVFRTGKLYQQEKSNVVFHRDGKTATISVIEQINEHIEKKVITTNGKPDAAIDGQTKQASTDEYTMILAAAIPMALVKNPKKVAVIGMGSGLTSHVFLSNSSIEKVETIEIEPTMIEGAKEFYERNHLVYDDPRSKIYIDDAKTFFTTRQKKYDIIMSEPSNPWVSGVASLFTEEYYQLITEFLSKKGIFAQWLQAYEINSELTYSILSAIDKTFKDYTIYSTNLGDILIIAHHNSMAHQYYTDIYSEVNVAKELSRINHTSLEDIKIHLVSNKKIMHSIIQTNKIKPNSDFFPIIQESADKHRFLGYSSIPLIRSTLSHIFQDVLNNKINIKKINKKSKFFITIEAKKVEDLLTSHPLEPLNIINKTKACNNQEVNSVWNTQVLTAFNKISWAPNENIQEINNNTFKLPCPRKKTDNINNYIESIILKKHHKTIKEVERFTKLNKKISLPMRISYLNALIRTKQYQGALIEIDAIKAKSTNNIQIDYLDSLLKLSNL
ncbi:fused MFS/spermidine synthase [Spartinivicinus ruber]|uniref:fused MFS/spermidine synthase n=1 Tax=Spartinivicinus ruber TaxID=2683272 RepID=UPI002E369809|nr:fused MFS/spermidine synthase [Spartinivicinus ruber]